MESVPKDEFGADALLYDDDLPGSWDDNFGGPVYTRKNAPRPNQGYWCLAGTVPHIAKRQKGAPFAKVLAHEDPDKKGFFIYEDCDQMRTKITRFLATKQIMQTAWLRDLQVNSNSFRRFMSLKGDTSGLTNNMFWAAAKFFHDKQSKPSAPSASSSSSSSSSTPAAPKESAEKLLERINKIQLPEDFELKRSCSWVRRQLNEFLALKVMSQTALLQHLQVNSNSYRRFMAQRGAWDGTSNGLYRAAGEFFEKKIRADKALKKQSKKAGGKAQGAKGQAKEKVGAKRKRKDESEDDDSEFDE